MSSIDERIVQMQFNNSQFEKGIKESLKSLDALKEGLDLEGSAKQLKALQKAGDSFSLAKMAEGIESVSKRFSTLGIVGMRVIDNLANSAYYNGKRLISSLSIDQVTAGWTKYGQKTASVQTIMNATGKSIDEVNGYLDKLMWFSDETSYGFTDMTQALGQLTSAGGDIERLIPMIEGIANATAFAGKGTGEFSRAMYNLNQSYSAGYLQYMDWKSLELAGIASKQLKEQLIEAGKATGKLNKDGKTAKGTLVTVSNLGQTLNEKWANTEVMEKAFGKFAEMTEKAYELVQEGKFDTASDAYAYLATQYDDISITAAKAAQEAKTFTEALDATKDAVSSSWMKTFELIFGNYDQAKVMWTDLANYLWDIFASGGEARNEMLQEWQELGGRDSLLAGVYDMFEALKNVIDAVKAAIAQVIPPMTAEKLVEISNAVKDFGASLKTLTEIRTEIIKKPSEADDEIDILGGFIPRQTKKVKADLEELERTINRGMRGDDVKKLQERLKQLGYDIGETGVDGIYGPKTQAALKKFQEDYGLAIDGIYGKLSHAKMSEALGIGDETESKKIRVAGKEITIYSDTLQTLQKIVKGAAAVVSIFGKALGFVFNVGKSVLGVFSPAIKGLFQIAGAIGDCFVNLNKFLDKSGIFDKWLAGIQKILQPVRRAIEGITKSVLGFFGIGEAAEKSGASISTFGQLWEKIKTSIQNSRAIEKFRETFEKLKASFKTLISPMKNFYQKVKVYLGNKFSGIIEWITDKISVAISAISDFFGMIADFVSPVIEKIPEYGKKIGKFFTDIFDKIKSSEKIQKIGKGITDFFSGFWKSVKGFVTGGQISGFISKIGDFFTGIYQQLSQNKKLQAAFEKVKAVVSSITSWVSETWGKLKEAVGGFFDKDVDSTEPVADQIKERFTAFEDLGNWMSSTWEKIKEKIQPMFENMKVNFEKFKNLNWGLIAVLGGVVVVIALAVKLISWVRGFVGDLAVLKGGKEAANKSASLADNFKKIAMSIGIIAVAIIAMGSMDPSKLDQGLKYIAIIMGSMTAILALSAIFLKGEAGNGVENAGKAFQRLGIAIGIIAASVVGLGIFYSTNKSGFVAGLLAVGGIMAAMAIMMVAVTRFGGSGKTLKMEIAISGMIKLAIAIGILAHVVRKIGSMSIFELAQGLAGLLGICVILKLIIKEVGKTGSIKIAGMIGLATAIAILAYVAQSLGKMPLDQLAKGVGSLVTIMIALSVFMKTINQFSGNPASIAGAVVTLTALGLFMYAFAEVVNKIKGADANLVIAFAGGIASMLVAIALALRLIDGIGSIRDVASNALKLGIATGILTVVIGGVLALVGELDRLTGGWISDRIERGAKVLEAIGNAISSMGTSFQVLSGGVVGLGTGVAIYEKATGQSGIAKQGFFNSLWIQGAFWSVSLIAGGITTGLGYLDKYSDGALISDIKNGAKVLEAISDALEAFDGPLGIAALAIVGISETLSFVKGVAGTKVLLTGWLDSLIIQGTFWTIAGIAGAITSGLGAWDRNQNGNLSGDIKRGGEVLATVGNALKGFDGPLGVAALAIAAISDALGMLGLKGTIAVGLGFVNASIITATFGAIADIAAACTAGLGVWDRKNDGQLIADIERGGEVLNSVGGALANLASGFKEEGTRSITESLGILADADVDQEKVDAAIQSAQSLNSVIEAWTSSTPMGFLSTITGGLFRKKDRFSYLTTTIDDFASTMQSVNTSLATITDQTVLNAKTAIDAATKVAEFFDLIASDRFNLEANGGAWSKFWFGDNKTESFIENLEGFGDNLNTFSEKVNSFSQGTTKDDLDVAIDALKKIAEVGMVTADMRFDAGVLSSITTSLPLFRRAFEDLKEELDEEKIDMSFVTSFSNAVGQIGNAVSAFASTDTESFKQKIGALKDVFSNSKDASSEGNSIFSNVSIDVKPITDACDKAVTTIRAYRSKFATAGKYMASGLAQGIKISASSARIAAENMARSALSGAQSILQIASPSKKTEEFGMYFSQGMAKGITAYSSAVTSASSDVSQQALNSVRASISGMSGLLDENVSSDPVIRPIVDLTNVGEGARAIRSMLSGGSTISVGSNVDSARAASASISRASINQNGSSSGNIDNSSVNSNAVNLSGNNFYIRSEQDIRSLASEIASLSYQQKRGLGGHA